PAAGLPNNSIGVETASALLARALQQHTPEVAQGDLTAVLTAFTENEYIAVDDGAKSGAEATVVVSGLPATDKDGAKKNRASVPLPPQSAGDKPLVLAGDGAGDGNVVAQVRADP